MNKLYSLFFIFFALIQTGKAQIPATPKEAFFRDWNYGPTGVFGLVKLDNTFQKPYYKIIKTDPQSTKVYSYNAAGMQTSMITIRFVNGKINQLARTDRWGDTYEITKFTSAGPDQFIVTRKSSGKNSFLPCKAARYIYKNGLLSELVYLDFNNKVYPFSDGVAIIRYKRYTDKNRYSLVNELSYFNEKDKPVISQTSDYHKVIYDYDNRCNQLSYAYYGTDNEPITNRYRAFKRKAEYDNNDLQTRGTTFGLNDEPVANSYGVAGTLSEYKNGLLTKSTRYDEHFKTTRASDAGDGIAIIKYAYDDRGNEIKRSYYDENEQPINGQSGYQSISYTYDPLDMLTSESYYDKYDNPAINRDGIFRNLYVRDDKGRLIQESYYDKENNPVKSPNDQVYMVKYKYDEQGRQVSESFWQNATTKMTRWNGYHDDVTKYNDEGQEIESAFYDENGKLFISSSGYSKMVTVYAPNGRLLERKYMNGNSCMMMSNSFVDNICSIKFTYDDKGRINNIRYYDISGNPVNASSYLNDADLTFHKVEFIYTGSRIIEERLYVVGNET